MATPDKVGRTLQSYTQPDGSVDLGSFIGSAIRGRSATWLAAGTFILIQIIAYGTLFVRPVVNFLLDN